MNNVVVVTAPSFEPVTLAEAKLWCRVDDDDRSQDAVLQMLIIAMREYAEHLTGRAFASRTLELRLDAFPDAEIELPQAPLNSVTSIEYVNDDGLQNLNGSPTAFQVDTGSIPGRIAPLVGSSWPSSSGDALAAVRIRYVAGYPNPNAIPKLVRLWMQARISTLFENREQIITEGQVQKLPRDFVDGLLDGLKVDFGFA